MKKYFLSFLLLGACYADSPPSFPYITHWTGDQNGIIIGFQTSPGCRYEVQNSIDLKNWAVVTNFTATGYSFSIFLSSDETPYWHKQFVRLKIDCSSQKK